VLSDEQKERIAEYSDAFSFIDSDKDVSLNRYSQGSQNQRGMRRRNRSVKQDKQWRTSAQERSVLRYSTGG
jgi:hypothetical protein